MPPPPSHFGFRAAPVTVHWTVVGHYQRVRTHTDTDADTDPQPRSPAGFAVLHIRFVIQPAQAPQPASIPFGVRILPPYVPLPLTRSMILAAGDQWVSYDNAATLAVKAVPSFSMAPTWPAPAIPAPFPTALHKALPQRGLQTGQDPDRHQLDPQLASAGPQTPSVGPAP